MVLRRLTFGVCSAFELAENLGVGFEFLVYLEELILGETKDSDLIPGIGGFIEGQGGGHLN